MLCSFVGRRPIRGGCVVGVCLALFLAARPSASIAAEKSPSYAHLQKKEGGPGWTFDDVAAAVPAGAPMPIDPGQPVPRVADAAAALRAAFVRLVGADAETHAVAYRIAAATAGQTKDRQAVRLVTLLQHHGIGTRADSGAAVRSALELVRQGDGEGCAFVGQASPGALWSTARNVGTLAALRKAKSPSGVRLTLPILDGAGNSGGDLNVGAKNDALPVKLATTVSDVKPGRVANLVGTWADGVFTAYLGEVPEPVIAFQWNVSSQSGGAYTQVRSVRVVVQNKGVQPIKSATLRVRCTVDRHNGGRLDRTVTVRANAVAPGGSQTMDVDFTVYNYSYEGLGTPKVEVTADKLEW